MDRQGQPSEPHAQQKRVLIMNKQQKLTLWLLARLDELGDEFDDQGATIQATQLDGLLDENYAEIEQIAAEEAGKCQ